MPAIPHPMSRSEVTRSGRWGRIWAMSVAMLDPKAAATRDRRTRASRNTRLVSYRRGGRRRQAVPAQVPALQRCPLEQRVGDGRPGDDHLRVARRPHCRGHPARARTRVAKASQVRWRTVARTSTVQLQRGLDLVGELGGGRVDVAEEAVDPVRDEVGGEAGPGRDGHHVGHHRLDQRDGTPFELRRRHEHVDPVVELRVGAVVRLDVGEVGALLEGRKGRRVPPTPPEQAKLLVRQAPDQVEDHVGALARVVGGAEADRPPIPLVGAEDVGIGAGDDDLDRVLPQPRLDQAAGVQ